MNETPDASPDAESDLLSGSGLEAEKAKRLAKLDDIRTNGNNPYPYRFDRTHTLSQIRAEHGELEPGTETETRVSIAGRMMLKREQGKLIFATVRDRSDESSCSSQRQSWAIKPSPISATSTLATG